MATALLPVEGVVAAGAPATPNADGNQHAEADPTPTPEPTATPEPTPSPTPTPSPVPTPGATPTPSPSPSPTATTYGAHITVSKFIDADGDLDTDGDPETEPDQTFVEGWDFFFETDATVTDSSENTWDVSYGPDGASVTLTEVERDGFELLDAFCDVRASGDAVVGELNGASLTFQLQVFDDSATYRCRFINTPSAPDIPLAGISVWKVIDADGDLDTFGDRARPPSWQFDAVFEEGVEILFADPDTDRDEPAGWVIADPGGLTRVVVTEVPQDDYRILAATCIDADSSNGFEIPTTLEGNSLSFEVSGFSDPNIGPHGYFCDFINAPVSVGALPTLPPTDAATGSVATGSEAWRIVLIGLAALIAGVLVLSSPAARTRGSTDARSIEEREDPE